MSSELQQKAATVLIGTSLTYYLYLSLSQTAHEVTPRKFSENNDAVLSLVNFEDEDAEQLALILPSWTGVIRSAEIADIIIFPDDAVSSDLLQVKSEARQAYYTIDSQNKQNNDSSTSAARPAALSIKTTVEIAGNQSLDVLLSPIEVATKAAGEAMEITCILGLCTGEKDGDVDIFQKTVHGRVTGDVKYLERLAAARRRGRSSRQNNKASSSSIGFSASNFLTLEDLFEPEEPNNSASLLEDRQSEWIKMFASAFSTTKKENEDSEDTKSDKTPSSSFSQLWKEAKIKAAASSSTSPMSSLLVTPWKYRAFIDLAHFLMYGQNERRYGSVFSGFGRGLAFGARSIKRLFGFASTGSISEGWRKLSKSVSNSLTTTSATTSATNSDSSSGNKKSSSSSVPADGSFSQHCTTDFGYNSEYPLCGRFEVHITVKVDEDDAEGSIRKFKCFSEKIGLKIVQIELPAGQHPTQLMTSYYMQGTVDRCTSGAFDLALQIFAQTGLEVQRVKLELQVHDIRAATKLLEFQRSGGSAENNNNNNNNSQLLRPYLLLNGPGLGLCPVRDFEANDRRFMTPTQYFEFHLKLKIPSSLKEGVLKTVREICNRFDAHLSKNAFKLTNRSSKGANSTSEDYLYYFVTLRLYGCGLITSLEKLEVLKTEIEKSLDKQSFVLVGENGDDDNDETTKEVQPTIHSIEREFAVFDSAAKLDKGWIDARTASNVQQW